MAQRYLLLIDILGFSQLVVEKSTEEVADTINSALTPFIQWESQNKQFKTIYFSDTFLFYQKDGGYADWAFLDIYAIGSMILCSLLARGIAARGAITFGEFEVTRDSLDIRQIYFGKALIEAHQAEQSENWIGITIKKSAWERYESEKPGIIDAFASCGTWVRRNDDLLLNPFLRIRGWYPNSLIGEVHPPYTAFDMPEFPNELAALKFVKDSSEEFHRKGDFTGRVAQKYHNTLAFAKSVLGNDIYEWAIRIALEAAAETETPADPGFY